MAVLAGHAFAGHATDGSRITSWTVTLRPPVRDTLVSHGDAGGYAKCIPAAAQIQFHDAHVPGRIGTQDHQLVVRQTFAQTMSVLARELALGRPSGPGDSQAGHSA
jgi:hypothetical protein